MYRKYPNGKCLLKMQGGLLLSADNSAEAASMRVIHVAAIHSFFAADYANFSDY